MNPLHPATSCSPLARAPCQRPIQLATREVDAGQALAWGGPSRSASAARGARAGAVILHSNLAVVAVTFCQNDSVAPGYLNLPSAAPFATGCVEVVKTSNTWFVHKIMQFSSSHRLVSHRPCIEDRDAVYKIAFGFSCNKRNRRW